MVVLCDNVDYRSSLKSTSVPTLGKGCQRWNSKELSCNMSFFDNCSKHEHML